MSTGVSPETRETTPRLHPSRRAIVKGAAWAAPVAAASVAAPAMAASPTQCAPVGTLFDAQARGRFLSGAIGGVNLDNVAAIEGAHAQAVAGTPVDEQSAGLDVSVLNTLNLSLGGLTGAVSDILTIVAAQDTGVLNQYAYANEAAEGTDTGEIGASGAVNQASGALTLDTGSSNPPELGSIDLRSLLQQVAGDNSVTQLLSYISDLRLNIGALAGRAYMDSLCVEPDVDQVERDYLIAYLRLVVESDLVGQLLTTLNEVLPTLTISTSAVWDLLEGVPLLGPLLSALGESALSVTATVDLSQLTGEPIPDEVNSALRIDFEDGTITLDVASLLGGAYTGDISEFLNELSPNTRLFVDAGLPGGAVVALTDSWVDGLIERLKDLVFVSVRAGSLTGVLPTGLLIEGTLREFLDGEATAQLVLAGVPVNLGAALGPLLESIGELVQDTLDTLLNDSALLDTALGGVNDLLAALFDVLSGVLAITVNAQNDASGTIPAYYQAITPAGRYDVAALHLEVLGIANLLNLSLARGSVGENTPR